MLPDDFILAMNEACKQYGSQKAFSKATGIHQSRISDYINGNYDFDNLTVGTLRKLFPKMKILFLGTDEEVSSDMVSDLLEDRMISMIRSLKPQEKIKCFEMMSRTFGDFFKEEAEK